MPRQSTAPRPRRERLERPKPAIRRIERIDATPFPDDNDLAYAEAYDIGLAFPDHLADALQGLADGFTASFIQGVLASRPHAAGRRGVL